MTEKSKISSKNIKDEALIIREAKPNLQEGILFAQLFNEASEGFFVSMLGAKTYEILAEAFVQPNNEYSFENAVMIEYKGKIVGMISGYSYTDKKRFQKNILSKFTKGAKLRILLFTMIGKLLSLFLGPRGQDDYYLQAIAVNSEIRGKGLGQRLLKQSEVIAIKRGAKTLSLDVSSKNKRAIKSYKKFGMKISSQWPNFFKLPPVFTRMKKKL